MAGSSSEFLLRTVSGLFIAGAVVGGIYFGGWVWFCVASVFALLSLGEYYRLLGKHVRLSRGIGYLCALAVLLSGMGGLLRPMTVILTLVLSGYAILMIEMWRRQLTGQSDGATNVGGTLSGVLLIVVPWMCIMLLRYFPTGTLILVTLFACTWGCDVMAYLVGRRWGRNRLCEQISPNKTWEGFIAGAVGSMFINAAMIYFLEQPPYPLFIIGLICSVAGQFSDLAESLIKRELGEKDSGHLIPGHGGVLDRFDSILLNGILTYLIFEVLL